MTFMDRSVLARRGEASCMKILIWVNATLQPLTLSLVAMGLVIKFGTFLLEDHIRSVLDDLMASLNMADEPEIDVGSYDLETIVSDLGIWFMSIGLGSSAMAVLGVAAGKAGTYHISLIYCILLGVTMFFQVGLVLVISIRRELIAGAIKPVMQGYLHESYSGFNGTDPFTQTWNLLMLAMQCCGVDSHLDFERATFWNRRWYQDGWWFSLSSPMVCCRFDGKQPGDFSCAVNPSISTSNYQRGCYDQVWSVIVEHKVYLIMAGSVLFTLQFMLFISAIVHTKAMYRRSSERTTDGTNVSNAANSARRFNGNKSIADLISSTTGILSQTSSPDASQDVRNLIDQGLSGNMFASANLNGGTDRNQPFMPFMGNFGHPPMSPLSQLLNQYCMQGRFSNPVDPFNPLNIFSTAFFNPYANGGGVTAENQRLDDITGLFQQQNIPGNQMVVPFLNRFPRFERLGSQFSIQGVPMVGHGSPGSLRRDDSRVCELYQNDADYGRDSRERTSSYHGNRDRRNSHELNLDRTNSVTAQRDRTSSHTD